ncbi:MAG TPA: 50S ribosomal protein L24 [Gemmatimonadaceae bacterium]|nr:50S ribosomal protein L24 [Gemmatimonadaceae bacterium]
MRVLKYRKTAGKRLTARHARNVERMKLNVSKGDTVRVMRGEDKGKEGKVIRVFLKTGRVLVEGVNMVKMHRKARTAEEQSGIREAPASIHHSNVMLLDPKSGQPTRVKSRYDSDASHVERRRSKERVGAKSGEPIPRVR